LNADLPPSSPTSAHDRQLLLRLAREAITAFVAGRPAHIPGEAEILRRRGGAFVTLMKGRDLRGCIGHMEANEPLGTVVPRCAVAACSSDPRFPPLAPSELDSIDIEISLLGPTETISGPQEIVVGRDGLIVERGRQRGVLLPQVAIEWSWDAEAFLGHTCRKAGLPRDAWRQGASVSRFEAEVFGETE
jgi:AmmeMemoRadiSam system protein A